MNRVRVIPLTFALMTAVSALAVAAVGTALTAPAAAQTAVDQRPAASLSDAELAARIKAAQAAVQDRSGDDGARKRLRQQMRADTAELKNRREAGNDKRQAPDKAERAERSKGENEREPRTERRRQAAPDKPAAPERRAAPESGDQPEKKAKPQRRAAPEQDAKPERRAAPEGKAAPERRQRAEPTSEREPVRRGEARDKGEQVERAEQPKRGDDRADRRRGEGDKRAQEILKDRRRANQLKDDPLRQRLDAIREILGAGTVSEQYAATLRQLLEQDREELRGRVDSRRGDRRPPRGDDRGSRGLAELLRDDRRSDALDERALKARSAAIRRALSDRNLRQDHAARLRAMQKADRRALARYLQAGREDRRRDLHRRRDAGSLTIEILRDRRPAPRHSITAAEADEAALELQLVAPPTRDIERQYSFEEYASRPEMREIMPGIEVDTIHFGFNEYFVGEEEIEQLDRIGEIMERIIAANPDEVFVVEGHTDAVGSDAYNLDLSGKRADAVKQALLDYFVIDPHNVETVGYGENYLKIVTPDEEVENRRVTVRRITPIIMGQR